MRSICLPKKANATSIVDSDAVLPCSIPFQSFKPIAWWDSQITQIDRRFKLVQLAPRNCLNARPTLTGASLKELLRVVVLEALNHLCK
jgi:hypothetical protein